MIIMISRARAGARKLDAAVGSRPTAVLSYNSLSHSHTPRDY
jgi:hypothetical protein